MDNAPQTSLTLHTRYDPDHRVVAITGAAGFLGAELIEHLESDRRFVKILAIDVQKPHPAANKTQFNRIDLTQPSADAEMAQLLREHGVDTLVHLAFLSKPTHNSSWAHELEAIGTMQMLNACAACNVRKLVVGSTTGIYGPHPHNPNFITEDQEPRGVPGSRFFADKLEAERLVRRFAHENPASVVTILRLAPILGPRVDNFVSDYFSRPLVPVLMGYDPLFQLLHEDDAVAALKLCVDADFGGIFNIAGEGLLPLSTILALAGKIGAPVPRMLAYPLVNLMWVTQVFDAPPTFLDFLRYICVVDTARSKKIMGYKPRRDIRAIVTEFAGTEAEHQVTESLR